MNNDVTKTMKGKILSGTVSSIGRVKTVGVDVVHLKRHPLYKKAVKRTKTYAVHTEDTTLSVGDKVRIIEVKPISKTKHFKILGKIGA